MPIEDNASDLKTDFALLESEEPVVSDLTDETEVSEPKPEIKKKVAPKVESPEPEAEVEEEIEQEEEEPKEILPHERPTIAAIKEEYPDFFKKFPTLKDAFFREKQFSEVFHTPAEARDAAATVEEFNDLRTDVVEGTGEKLLPALKESDSLGKFSKNFLPNLFKVDKDLHWQVVLPIIEDVVRIAYADGVKRGDDNLKWGAYYVAQNILGDPSIAEGKKTLVVKDEPSKPDPKVTDERTKFENERYNAFNIDVHEAVYNGLVNEVRKGFKDDDGLTKFMRSSIEKAVIDEVVNKVKADKEFSRYKDRLWKEAKSSGYRTDDKSRIINASLARAKSLVSSIRRGLIGEALGNLPSEQQKRKDKLETVNSRKEPGSSGRDSSIRQRTPAAKNIDWKKTSDIDFLNDQYVPKGKKDK